MALPPASAASATGRRWTRRITDSRARWRCQQLAAAASGVSAPHRFVAGELRGGTRTHTTRRGHPFIVRHGTSDVDLVAEVFGRGAYRMPDEVSRRLGPDLHVVDAGGNIGLFGISAIEQWDVARLRSFEPDPANAALLARVIASDRSDTDWRHTEAAVSTSAEPMRFIADGSPVARRAADDEAGIVVPSVDLFEALGDADVLKLDIEGGEWALLGDPRWPEVKLRAIVMEWHWRNAPAVGGHQGARAALGQAGFRIVETDPGASREDVGLIWGVR